MFDAETTSFIQSAAPLDGLDLERLPQDLTNAYALVVSARLGAIDVSTGQAPTDWQDMIQELRRLAETYEGLTIFLPRDDNHRPACAFVAGSAHFTLNQAERLQMRLSVQNAAPPSLSPYAVAPEVAATLLFLIGGHQADAAEATKAFIYRDTSLIANQLLDFIAALASGDGRELLWIADTLLQSLPQTSVDYLEMAADAMWLELARAVQLIARSALGLTADDPLAVINGVIEKLSRANQPIQLGKSILRLQLPLAGPYHLARLLQAAAEVLLTSTVTATRPPEGIDDSAWSRFARHFAAQRPFLWRNHIKAIDEGFLEAGSSFVLTFPTGAGKTTLTELRIATELMRGRTVVYLAPTRALVDQVATEISRTVRPIAQEVVRGRFMEDFGEKAEAKVFVQTPEQCLTYLAYEPGEHRDIGLIVVDECHQLCERPNPDGSLRQPGRRAIDAMWTLLSLLQRSPEADIILISAMVRNGAELVRWLETVTEKTAKVLDLAWKPTRQVRGVVAYEASEISPLNAELQRRKAARGGRNPRKADRKDISATPVGLFCHTQVWNTTSTFAKFPLLSESVPLGVNRYWDLSANRNEIGGKLLGAMARAGMRPIVFSQRIDWAHQIAKEGTNSLEQVGVPPITLLQQEKDLFAATALELGNANLVELPAGKRIGIHHGLLLLSERLAMESAFRRPDGLLALVATPTVTQGINLPAEAVIIAGDDRWEEDGPEMLAVHELLNAAGRAGRAGHYAHGIVIDLPGKVFSVSQDNNGISFNDLQHVLNLFGLPDQCLDVVDPLTQVIDRIAQVGADSDISQYLVRRIGGLDDSVLRAILGSTLGNALRSERNQRAEEQATLLKSMAITVDNVADADDSNIEEWRELAGQAGISPLTLAAVAASLPDAEILLSWSFEELLEFHNRLLLDHPGMLFGLVDPSSSDFIRIMPRRSRRRNGRTENIEGMPDWEQRWQDALREVLPQWLSGKPLIDIGQALHRHRQADGRVKAIQLGRRFALQTAGGLGHGLSLVARVIEHRYHDRTSELLLSWLRLIPGCVREGFDEPDKLLFFWQLRRHDAGLFPRVRVHQIYDHIVHGRLAAWEDLPDIDARRKVIRVLIDDVAQEGFRPIGQ
jgi:hypothetical protein